VTKKKYILFWEEGKTRLAYLDTLQQVERKVRGREYSLLENTPTGVIPIRLLQEHISYASKYLQNKAKCDRGEQPVPPTNKCAPKPLETCVTWDDVLVEDDKTYNISKLSKFRDVSYISKDYCPWCIHSNVKGLLNKYNPYSENIPKCSLCNKLWILNGGCGNFMWRLEKFEKEYESFVQENKDFFKRG
jgi:hypothetical protein